MPLADTVGCVAQPGAATDMKLSRAALSYPPSSVARVEMLVERPVGCSGLMTPAWRPRWCGYIPVSSAARLGVHTAFKQQSVYHH